MIQYEDFDEPACSLQVEPGSALVRFQTAQPGEDGVLAQLDRDSVAALVGQLVSWLNRTE